jgi:hypothetical protein
VYNIAHLLSLEEQTVQFLKDRRMSKKKKVKLLQLEFTITYIANASANKNRIEGGYLCHRHQIYMRGKSQTKYQIKRKGRELSAQPNNKTAEVQYKS